VCLLRLVTVAPDPPAERGPDGLTVPVLRRLFFVSLAVPVAAFVALCWFEFDRAVHHARASLSTQALMVREHAAKAFLTNEVLLESVVQRLGSASNAAISARESWFHRELVNMSAGVKQAQGVLVWDAQGSPIASSRYYPVPRTVSIADRPFFARHQSEGIAFSSNEAVEPRIGSGPLHTVSRARWNGTGFAGIVTVSLSTRYLSEFYAQMAGSDEHMTVALFRAGGDVIVQHPVQREATMPAKMRAALDAQQGEGVLSDTIDGARGIVAFRKIGDYPVYATVSRSYPSVLREWRHDTLVIGLFVFPGALALAYMTWLALQNAQRERDARVHWRQEMDLRREAERHLMQAHKYEALGEMTGGLAHDFNNLLHIVTVNAAMLALNKPGSDTASRVDAISRAAASGKSLVAHLLAFARRQSLSLTRVATAEFVGSVCELARHSLPAPVQLEYRAGGGVWETVVDRSELELAVINLIVNARDAMPAGGSISVSTCNVASGSRECSEARLGAGDYVAIAVADTGHGIPDDVLPRIFEPLFTTKEDRGSGLGLSRVYGYITQIGGTVTARNVDGGGAVLTLYVPRAKDGIAAARSVEAPYTKV
jgi:signal transduction histidine kinase